MKQDVINGTMTIVVEPDDERLHVLAMLEQLADRRLIVVLPNDAVFRRPGDLRELKLAASQVNIELILVIVDNESLRLWARRQGFSVFSSVESCARAQQAARLSRTTRLLFTEEQEITGPRGRDQFSSLNDDNELWIEDVSDELYPPKPIIPPQPIVLPVLPEGQFKVPGARIVPRVTEPLYTRTAAQRNLADTPADVQLVDVQKALYRQIAEEKAQDRLSQPFSLLPNTSVADQQSVAVNLPVSPAHGIWPDRFLFVLVALLVLGIVGGVGFAYLLTLAHGVAATIAPTSLTPGFLVYQVVY